MIVKINSSSLMKWCFPLLKNSEPSSHPGNSSLDPNDMPVTYSLLLSIVLPYWMIKNWSSIFSSSFFPQNFLKNLMAVPPHGGGTHRKILWDFRIQVYIGCKVWTEPQKLLIRGGERAGKGSTLFKRCPFLELSTFRYYLYGNKSQQTLMNSTSSNNSRTL